MEPWSAENPGICKALWTLESDGLENIYVPHSFGFRTAGMKDVLSRAKDFMGPLVFGFPAVVSMQMITAALQGRGDARTPMIIAAIVNGSNLLLGYLLIFGPGPFPELGVRGAALTLSQILGTGLGLMLFGKLLKQKNLSSGQNGKTPEKTPLRHISWA